METEEAKEGVRRRKGTWWERMGMNREGGTEERGIG